MFESGNFDIEPRHLDGVVALSSGNSLYIAKCLLSGPAKMTENSKVERVLGNLGRAEMVALIAPSTKPAQKAFDYNCWEQINHAEFDGSCQDCFQTTTLHLSFTDYEQPVDVGTRGIKDTEVVLLESVVSVHDRGKWISDIDVVSSLSSDLFSSPYMQSPCHHSAIERAYSREGGASYSISKIVTVDNWEELLDLPPANVVIRAHGNWLAQLAATAISTQNSRATVVFPPDPCWRCLWMCNMIADKGQSIIF
jgi:hypothetical protein